MGLNGGIIWLASYPKSGNTWLRVFLANLRHSGEGPVDINKLNIHIASAREIFDEATGVEASDLAPEDIDRLRSATYKHLAALSDETLFVKIHDAYTQTADGRPLVPPQATRGALYLIRNPLDVAVSFTHHFDRDIDGIIDRMGDDELALASSTFRQHGQLRQRLLSWSSHVLSWVEAPIRVLVLRYEDMKLNPLATFTKAAQFAGLPADPERVRQAVEYSDFKVLQRQEQEKGFIERPSEAERFFRKGACGGWRRKLTSEQVARLVRDHQEVMKRFGYLTEDGKIFP
jgi:aryl sulfotransferase